MSTLLKNKKVSIIIPVYNVEKYVTRCVESILEQNHSNIEIIFIDDGSQDKSGKILDNYAKKDSRIIIIHQKNAGVSKARNVGLKKASGDYIMFVDGDDYVEKDYVAYFLELVVENSVQMAVGNRCYNIDSQNESQSYDTKIVSAETIIEDIYIDLINVAVWNKIYSRELIVKNNITFNPNIWYGEGMLFNIECLQYADKVAIGSKMVYHQIFNPNSAMRNFKIENQYCGMESLKIQKTLWKKRTKRIEEAWEFHYRNFYANILRGLISLNQEKKEIGIYRDCKKNMRKNILLPWKMKINLKRKIVLTAYAIVPYIISKITIFKNKKRALKQANLLNFID